MMRVFAWVVSLLIPGTVFGICASLISGQLAVNVEKCGAHIPEKTFSKPNDRLKFIGDLSPDDRKQFFNSYRGVIVEGRVVRSLAIKSGLSPEKGVLNGQSIKAYIPPGNLGCKPIYKKRIRAQLEEACCEGGGQAPCLLGMSYVLKNPEVLGDIKGGAGNAKRMLLSTNKKYLQANSFVKKRKYRSAIPIYKELKELEMLDLRGHFFYGYSLYRIDKCKAALPVLEYIYKKSQSNSYWANEEKTMKKGVLLYARCFSRLGKTGNAVQILQSFLANPKLYRAEIKESLSNSDFGRIKTTTDFQSYMNDAQKALSKVR